MMVSAARASILQRYFAWLMAQVSGRYNRELGPLKRSLFADLEGTVLEIGPGTGPNLSFFPTGVRWIGLEPNPGMHPRLRDEADRLGLEIELRSDDVQDIELPDASVDAVVSTLVLCSVGDLDATLAEIARVLRPGGCFVFLEHVAAEPGTWLRRTQGFVCPAWRALNDNCHPDRDTEQAIVRAGFVDLRCESLQGPLPIPIIKPHIVGSARKPG
jgi:SAM-dependent methyltransferase